MPKTEPTKINKPNNINNYPNSLYDNLKIKEFNSKSVDFMLKEKYENALEILKTVEIFLEANIIETNSKLDKKLLSIILHNIACCYQKIKDYNSCISYLEAVIFHFDNYLETKHKFNLTEEYFLKSILSNKIKKSSLKGDFILELRFSAKFHLQMCAVLSQGNKHIEALSHAKLAMLMSEDNIIKTFLLFYQIKNKEFSFLTDKLSQSKIILKELYKRIIVLRKQTNNNDPPLYSRDNKQFIFDSYNKYRNKEIDTHLNNVSIISNIRTVFGKSIMKDDWIQLLNIGNIMYLSPLNNDDLDLDTDSKYELLRDAILEKLVILTVAYFSLATELRFISKDKNNINNIINGEFYHLKAIEFASLFLPVSCPIIKHYIYSYYQYYGNDMDIVKEGEVLNNKIELLRSEVEIDKDVLTFITSKKIEYIRKKENPISKNYEMFSNNNITAYKSKIKDEKAPKFKLNFMNLNQCHINNNNYDSNISETFANCSNLKESSIINNNYSYSYKEYNPRKNKFNQNHQSNSLNNSKLVHDKALLKTKSKTERIKLNNLYINTHSHFNKEINDISESEHSKTKKAKSSGRVKSQSKCETSPSKDKCFTQRGLNNYSKNNVYSKSKPNSKTTSKVIDSYCNSKVNISCRSQMFSKGQLNKKSKRKKKHQDKKRNGNDEESALNHMLIEKIFSNRIKKTEKDNNIYSSSNSSVSTLIKALNMKIKK